MIATGLAELFDLTGRTALISGASGYLGKAFASTLAEAGAQVIVTSRSQARAEDIARTLPRFEELGHRGIELDQLDDDSLKAGFAEAVADGGSIDVLVNNGHEHLTKDWTNTNGEEFTRQLSNATGYFLLARLVRDHAVAQQRAASIIMIGSMYGVVGSYPDAYEGGLASPVAYHALKGGIVHMTRHLAVYWAKDNVRVNTLSPGPFPSETAPLDMVERLKPRSPMGRMGKPEELKGALIYFASDASSYVTGQNLLIDGGWTAW